MELKVGSNIKKKSLYYILPLLIRHMYFIFFVSSYIFITFMNIITFDYFVFTKKMLESVVKRREFVYIRE